MPPYEGNCGKQERCSPRRFNSNMKVRQDIEILRVLSAFGIVWFHSGAPGRAFAYSGLVIFIILSVYLSQHGNQHISTRFRIRARRLLVPWSIWFSFYGLIRLLTQKPLIPLENGAIAGVLSGPSSHLWYLPFIFVLLVIIDSARVKLPPSILAWTGYALAILAFVSWGRWSVPENPSEYPWMQYGHAMTGIFLGIFMMHYGALPRWLAPYLLGTLLIASASAISIQGYGIPYTVGICLSAIVLLTPEREITFNVQPLSRCTLGIYLLHPLILMIMGKFVFASPAEKAIVAFAGSALLIWLFKKYFTNLANYVV